LGSARLLGCGGIACIQGTNAIFGFCNLAWNPHECSVLTVLLGLLQSCLATAQILGYGEIACIQGTNAIFGFCNLAWKSHEYLALTELLAFLEQIPTKHFKHLQHQISSYSQACFCTSTLHKRISYTQDIIYAPDIFTAKVRSSPNTALFLHTSLETPHLLGSAPLAWQPQECLASTRWLGITRFCDRLNRSAAFAWRKCVGIRNAAELFALARRRNL
jgi:hypothetical protein